MYGITASQSIPKPIPYLHVAAGTGHIYSVPLDNIQLTSGNRVRPINQWIRGMAYNPNTNELMYVAEASNVGSTLNNGTSWSNSDTKIGTELSIRIRYFNNEFIILSNNNGNTLYKTPSYASTPTLVTVNGDNIPLRDIYYDGTYYYLYGNSLYGQQLKYNTSLINTGWTQAYVYGSTGSAGAKTICSNNTNYILIDTNYQYYSTTPRGGHNQFSRLTQTKTSGTTNYNNAVYDGSRFFYSLVATTAFQYVLTNSTGSSFTTYTIPSASGACYGVDYEPTTGTYILFGTDANSAKAGVLYTTTTPTIASSWTKYTPDFDGAEIRAVCISYK